MHARLFFLPDFHREGEAHISIFPANTTFTINLAGGRYNEGNRHCQKNRRPWACGHTQRNQKNNQYPRGLHQGDPLEIFTDREGEIILKKYSPIGELGTFAKEYAESLAQTVGHITCIVDKDQIIAVSGGGKKEFFEKHISSEMENCINKRTSLIAERNDANFVPVLEDDSESAYNHQLIVPIIAEGDAMGAIIFLSKDQKMGEVEGKLAQTAAGFLGKQMEQ